MCSKQCECGIYSMDSKTPLKVHLTGYYKRSFAFYTIKERWPVILTKLIDSLVRDKEKINETYKGNVREEIKAVIGEISKLKYEIQTNKPMLMLQSNEPDAKIYNNYLNDQSVDGTIRYYTAIWLHAECYMYRRIKTAFENTKHLKRFDYFKNNKNDQFYKSIDAVNSFAEFIYPILRTKDKINEKENFIKLLKLNLWGNRCDLSISAGNDNFISEDPLSLMLKYEEFILADNSEQIWWAIKATSNEENRVIEFVNDNAGYELFTDLCLADFLISNNLTDNIIFNVKPIPWFVSDALPDDIKWIIRVLINSENQKLKKLGIRWNKYIRENIWQVMSASFWILPVTFTKMMDYDRELYDRLKEAQLIIFKGDLNYRKLFGEKNWESTTSIKEALQGFQPTKLCSLRTVKADMICGLPKGVAQHLDEKDPSWMITGNYGVIQFSEIESKSE